MSDFNVPDTLGTPVNSTPQAQPVAPAATTTPQFTVPDTLGTPVSKPYDIADTISNINSGVRAGTLGFERGVSTYSATIDKAISKGMALINGGKPVSWYDTPQDAQNKYLELQQQTPDTIAHPTATGVGNFVGQGAMTLPAMYATGGTSSLGMAAQGFVAGGFADSPTQGTDIFNPKGAAIGTVAGGLLPAVASSWGSQSLARTALQSTLANAGYKGPVADIDVPAPPGTAASLVQQLKGGLINQVAARIPIVSNIPGVGVAAARATQQQGVSNAITNYISKLADSNSGGNEAQFIGAIQSAKASGDQAIQDASNEFRGNLANSNITSAPMPNTVAATRQILGEDYPLSKPALQNLSAVQDNMPINKVLGFKDDAGNWNPGLKQQVWSEYERLQNLGNTNTDAFNASLDMRQLYDHINNDMSTLATNNENITNPAIMNSFQKFNAVTSAVKNTWDPATMPLLAKAAKNLDDAQTGAVGLWNAMNGKNIAPAQLAKYSNVIGQQGMNAVQAEQLQNMMVRNTSGDTFNVSNFLNDLANQPQGSQRATILQPAQDVLGGLQQFANRISQSSSPGAGSGAIAGGVAVAAHSMPRAQVPAAIVAGGLSAMGAMTMRPPLKAALGALNKVTGDFMPGTAQFLQNNAAKALQQAGIVWTNNPDGSVKFDTQQNQ